MNCHWKPNPLKGATTWVLIQQVCQGSMDYQRHQCIQPAVDPMIPMVLLRRTQNHESHPTLESYSHTSTLMQILMVVVVCICRLSILVLTCEGFPINSNGLAFIALLFNFPLKPPLKFVPSGAWLVRGLKCYSLSIDFCWLDLFCHTSSVYNIIYGIGVG